MNPDIFLITGSLGVCLALAVLVIVLVDRARRRAAVRDRLAEVRARAELPPAAPDNTTPANAAVLDALELLWAMPAYGETTDHTTKGDS